MERLKHLFRLSLLLFCGLAVSCSNDDGEVTFLQEDYPVTLGTAINNLKSSTGNTWDGGEQVAVKIGSEVKNYTTASSGSLTVTSGTPFYWQYQSETKTVQAWYPYSASAPTSWSVQAGQSGTGYQQSDLLYAPATDISFANRNSASLPFYHQTAKVVVNIMNGEAATSAAHISGVKIGDNDNLALSGSYAAPTGNATQGTWSNLTGMGVVSPKDITSGTSYLKSYATLVIPQNMASKKFIVITLANGNTYYYTPTGTEAALQGGKQYTYNITVKNGYLEVETLTGGQWTDGGNETVASYIIYGATDLKPGDFFYRTSNGEWATSDGGLRKLYTDGTGETVEAYPDDSKGTLIGIVFWVGDPTEGNHNNGTAFTDFGDPALASEQSQCTHGLVVALEDASSGTLWQTTVTDVGNWTESNTSYGNIATDTGATDALNKLRGYNNTQAIWAYNAEESNTSKVLPVQDIDSWAASNPAPATSSDWYLPSAKELTLLCGRDVNDIWRNSSGGTGMRDIVNGSINQTGAPDKIEDASYWSGTEGASDASSAFSVTFSSSTVRSYDKTRTYSVRSVLAF